MNIASVVAITKHVARATIAKASAVEMCHTSILSPKPNMLLELGLP